MKTIQKWFCDFFKKEQKSVSFQKNKKQLGCLFFLIGFFSTLIVFQSFL